MCRLMKHDHAWSKCPNNPISKNCSCKPYTEIPVSERYENNFAKKAEKWSKEEKGEAKKKVSVKKEDLHAISNETKTLSVSIKDEKEFNIWIILNCLNHFLRILVIFFRA